MSPLIGDRTPEPQPVGTLGLKGLHHPMPPSQGAYEWVYLWQLPVRAMHWIAAACVVLLILTGLYIGRPYFLVDRATSASPILNGVRLSHFVAAGVLIATGIVRGYWLVAGNKYERFAALFPVRKSDWVSLWKMIKYYVFIHPKRAPHYLGHNPLQQLAYTLVYVVALVMVVTGFALYGQSNPYGVLFKLFGWVAPAVGGLQMLRVIHHVLTWFFVTFIPIHVYLAIRADVIDRGGTISSIISGGRFVDPKEDYIDA